MVRVVTFAVLVLLLSVVGKVGAQPLKIGILPVVDTLPLHVAVNEGLFAGQGLDVELVPFASAMERDMAIQAGKLDGFFGDMIITLLLLQSGVDMRISTVSYKTRPGQRMFSLLAAPGKDVQGDMVVGISRSSIIEYLLERMLVNTALPQANFTPMEVKKIPIRMQMLLSGQIGSALLPEPLVSLAESKGAKVLATDEDLDLVLTVVCLHGAKLKFQKPFTAAYAAAVERINADPERYRPLMTETSRIPGEVAASFPVYRYPSPALPSREDVRQLQDWMQAKGMLQEHLAYERVVAGP
ncbi:MAG: ABC transporter substrate-binding protein [Desulfovibrionales bacterium]